MAVLEAGVTVVLEPITMLLIREATRPTAIGTSVLNSLSGREGSRE